MATSISPTRARPGCTIRPGGSIGCRPSGRLDCLIDTGISPNGLVLDPTETVLFVAMTRDNAVWRMPFMKDGSVSKVGRFCSTFGASGPDGMTMDKAGPAVRRACLARPCLRVRAERRTDRAHQILRGPSCTNVAIGGRNATVSTSRSRRPARCWSRISVSWNEIAAIRQGGPPVSVIGQGTWYIDRGDRNARSRRCAAASISA